MNLSLMKGKKVIITGGCGFVGTHLRKKLFELGVEVHVLDNLFSSKYDNDFPNFHNVDILDKGVLNDILNESFDLMFHLAAHFGHPRSLKDPNLNLQVNLQGTLNLLEACRKYNIKMVFSSTFTVYGVQDVMPLDENMNCNPLSLYDVSKLAAERYLKSYHNLFQTETVSVRFSNIYGPGDPQGPYRSAVSNLIGQVLREQSPTLHFKGKATRDFIHIDDIVMALIAVGITENISGEVINLCTGVETTVKELTDYIIKYSKSNIKPILVPANKYYSSNMVGSPLKALEKTGFKYRIKVPDGLKKTIEWAIENYNTFSVEQPYSYNP